jgi:hypothetical protein
VQFVGVPCAFAFGWLAGVWPHRFAVLAALATLALILILVQAGVGFGLERSMRGVASARFAEERKAAQAAGDQATLDAINYREGQELSRFNLERTTWFQMVVVFHVLDPHELDFPFTAPSTFEDLETGEKFPVVPEKMRDNYRDVMREHVREVEKRIVGQGAEYALLNTREPLDMALFKYLLARQKARVARGVN